MELVDFHFALGSSMTLHRASHEVLDFVSTKT